MAQNGRQFPDEREPSAGPAAGKYVNHYIRNSLTAILGYSMSGNYEKVEEIVMSLVEHFENTGVLRQKEQHRSMQDDETRFP